MLYLTVILPLTAISISSYCDDSFSSTDSPDVSGGTHVSDVQSEEIIKRYLQSYSSSSWNIVDLFPS